MPDTQRQIILNGLRTFQDEGGEGWVTFQSLDEEHWLQYAPDTLNMDWPFRGEPGDEFVSGYFQPLGRVERLDWEMDTFATFATECHDWEILAGVIDDLFCRLYGLGRDYRLDWRVER